MGSKNTQRLFESNPQLARVPELIGNFVAEEVSEDLKDPRYERYTITNLDDE